MSQSAISIAPKARIAAKVGGDNPPTFHEVRSLGSFLLAQQGEAITDIQELMAHSDEAMTALYQSGHPLPWTTVEIKLRGVGFRDGVPGGVPAAGESRVSD
jgi:integrase